MNRENSSLRPQAWFRFLLIALFILSAAAAQAAPKKVKVCHIPPGNPANFHTITINENALPAHLGHGDLPGSCADYCDQLCDDGDPCTIDACDAAERCELQHPPVNCDDSNLCTTDSCNPATGCESAPVICSDGENCTVDACDPLTGSCVAPPVDCPDGQSCDPDNGDCVDDDPCEFNDCVNGSCSPGGGCLTASTSCTPPPGGDYVCTCDPGWTGTLCDTDIDECADNPCVHGDCFNGENRYDCLCEDGWSGTNCDTPDSDPCAGVVCPDDCHFDGVCSNGVCTQGTPFPDGTVCRGAPPSEVCADGICYRY